MFTRLTNSLFVSEEERKQKQEQVRRERFELLRELKGKIHSVVEFALVNVKLQEEESNQRRELDERDAPVKELCIWLERCLWHGMREHLKGTKKSPTASVTLWDFVLQLRTIFKSTTTLADSAQLAQSVNTNTNFKELQYLRRQICLRTLDQVEDLLFVNTDVGKSHAWLRIAINNHVLDLAVSALVGQPGVVRADPLRTYYESVSLLRNQETCSILVAMLAGLNGLKFNIHADLEQFNHTEAPPRRPVMLVGSLPSEESSRGSVWTRSASSPKNRADGRDDREQDRRDAQEAKALQQKLKSAHGPSGATKWGFGNVSTALNDTFERATKAIQTTSKDVSKLRFKSSGGKQQQISTFGTPLHVLVTSPHTCAMGLQDCKIGVPDLLARCIAMLWSAPSIQTPDLFSNIVRNPGTGRFNEESYNHHDVMLLKKEFDELGSTGLFLLYQADIDRDTACATVAARTIEAIQNKDGMKEALNPYSISNLLKVFLRQLPNPLIPYDLYDAFMACHQIGDRDACLRNLQCLIDTLPDENKPTFDLLISLMARACAPEQSAINGSDSLSVATAIAPCVLRPNLTGSPSNRDANHLNRDVSDDGVCSPSTLGCFSESAEILALISDNYDHLFDDVKTMLVDRKKQRYAKLHTLVRVSRESTIKVNGFASPEHEAILKQLWDALTPEGATENDDGVFGPVSDGWLRRGFSSTHPSHCFRGGGLNALKDILYFAKHYSDAARNIIRRQEALDGTHQTMPRTGSPERRPVSQVDRIEQIKSNSYYPFIQAAVQLSRLTIELLHLEDLKQVPLRQLGNGPRAETSDAFDGPVFTQGKETWVVDDFNPQTFAALQMVARKPWWSLLDDPDATHKVFSMVLTLFDFIWKDTNAMAMDFNRVKQETKVQALEFLRMGPMTVDDLWALWISKKCNNASATQHFYQKSFVSNMIQTITKITHEIPQNLKQQIPQAQDHSQDLSHTETSGADSAVEEAPEQAPFSMEPVFPTQEDQPTAPPSTPGEQAEQADTHELDSENCFLPSLLSRSDILTRGHVEMLETALPQQFQGYDWNLSYNSTRHGSSLSKLMHQVSGKPAGILVIKDLDDGVFGAFLPDPLKVHAEYYGSGEMFLFQLSPKFESFRWSHGNDYFVLANEDALAFGGGGEFGLYLDGDLKAGTTGVSETFQNTLLSANPEFRCLCVEFWTFVSKMA